MLTESLLIELGTEELPPKALKTLGLAFRDGVVVGLEQNGLNHGEVRWFASPRRLAVLIKEVEAQAPDKELEILGPPVDRAKDEDGNWTPAATGFARKQGIDPDQLQQLETPKGLRLGVRSTVSGARAADKLVEIINSSIQQLPIPKRMRWGASRIEFVRPVQWVVTMLGKESSFGEILGQTTGAVTYGHRFHSSGPITLTAPEDYEDALEAANVIPCFEKRQALILKKIKQAAADIGANPVIDPDLLDEVTGLVEWPVALAGSFDESFLEVPAEALISSMKEHQKYFHLVDDQDKLRPNFITLANIESTDPDQVIKGNERVIRPRLSDAAFFFNTDKKTTLADRLPKLEKIVFQKQLGTLKDKTDRIVKLAGALATELATPVEHAERAALLSKTDLLSDMVLEFSDMQGVAGYYYALHDGEDAEVANALVQQYWPRFSGDKLPETDTACILALADRLDTLVGIFGIGQPPTGSKDPFALRRSSLAILRILVEKGIPLDLRTALALAASGYSDGIIAAGTTEQVFDYMIERFRAWFEDVSIPAEVFKSVSAKGISQPLDIQKRVMAVDEFTRLEEASALAAANKRVSNILNKLDKQHRFSAVDPDLLVEPAEQQLARELDKIAPHSEALFESADYAQSLASLAALKEPVDAFFDGVMVNAEDEKLRFNRLNLLKALKDLFEQVADISQLAVN
ncbi:MAG: glycine--tRNA ligase subunit beta [Halioglobus sp.]